MKLRSGDVLAMSFRVEALMGEGGFGRIYLAEGPDGKVALKAGRAQGGLSPSAHQDAGVRARAERNGSAWVAGQDAVDALLLAQARYLEILDSPMWVSTSDVLEKSGRPVLLLPFVEGRTLRQCMAERCPIEVRSLLRLIEVLRAEPHRDLKPEDILLEPSREVRILDPGSVALTGIASAGELDVRTPEYDAFDTRSDAAALAAIVFELLTGRRPYRHFIEGDTAPSARLSQISMLAATFQTASSQGTGIPTSLDLALTRVLQDIEIERARSLERSQSLSQWRNPGIPWEQERCCALIDGLQALARETETIHPAPPRPQPPATPLERGNPPVTHRLESEPRA